MSETKTATMASQEDRHLRAAMHRLLHRLRRFVAVYPMKMDDKMPEHDLVWVAGVGDGESPEREILDAIKSNPVLWQHALPEEVCLVPRKSLERLGITSEAIETLAYMGESIVASNAVSH